MKNKIHASSIAGFIIAVIGLYFLHDELHGTVADHTIVWIAVGIFGLGAFLMFPAPVSGFAKTIVVFLPKLSFGSRETDVPIQAAPPGTKPGDPVTPAVIAAVDPDKDKP